MMNIKIICVGDFKEKYLTAMNDEYLKRLSKYCKVETIVLKDEKLPDNLNQSYITQVKNKEGIAILSKIKHLTNPYIYVLDEKGVELTSIQFAQKLNDIPVKGYSTICFIIGGSLGLSDEVKNIANETLSFSKLTYPHQLIRVFLLEQIFRCFKINNNEQYHH